MPDDDEKSDLYDFEIYEAEVTCNSIDDFSKNKPFVFPNDFKNIDNQKKIKGTVFPKSKLPQILPVIISANDKTFGINVLEPKLFEFSIIRKLHQTEGDEVFGSFNAYITGYVFDYEREEVEEIIGPILGPPPTPPPPPPIKKCESNGVKTGKFEEKQGYIRHQFFCRYHPDTVWGPWEIKEGNGGIDNPGCLSNIISLIGIILLIVFIIATFPFLLYLIGFYIIIFLIGFLAPYFKWIFRILGIILLLAFIGSLVKTCSSTSHRYNPKPPVLVDNARERKETRKPIVENNTDNSNNNIDNSNESENKPNDYLIKRYREWKDYDGNIYQGYYTLRKSEIENAHKFKSNLQVNPTNRNSYDEIVFNLKENDKNKLNGVYKLLDSIQAINNLSKIKFAEMAVSFVQDIPYVLILDEDCDPKLYTDDFTKKYLSNPNAKCSGFQRFGINTPVEFLYNLNGDCDTRTLLLYTILSHYNYDVAMMSSEFYGHSILGINLPINGTAYNYNNQRYVLWETTTPNIKPGNIPNEISNLNNWRISLKSK